MTYQDKSPAVFLPRAKIDALVAEHGGRNRTPDDSGCHFGARHAGLEVLGCSLGFINADLLWMTERHSKRTGATHYLNVSVFDYAYEGRKEQYGGTWFLPDANRAHAALSRLKDLMPRELPEAPAFYGLELEIIEAVRARFKHHRATTR